MDCLSLECRKSVQNLAPMYLSSSIFITFFHKFYTVARLDESSFVHAVHFYSSEPLGMLFSSMFICPSPTNASTSGRCPDPSRSDGSLTTVQLSKAQSISYFKSCLVSLKCLRGRSVSEASSLSASQAPGSARCRQHGGICGMSHRGFRKGSLESRGLGLGERE